MRLLFICSIIVLIAACTAPKPKTVSGKRRTVINTTEIVIPGTLPPTQKKEIVAYIPPTPSVFRVHFAWESTVLETRQKQLIQLLPVALKAERIEIRGRTDNTYKSAFDKNIAKGRAVVMREFLIRKGVDPRIIYTNYLSAADYMADNNTGLGRALNRRAEIIIYHPQVADHE